ncbi:MAG: HAD family hydrolase [Actinomycetota bacterium]
MVFFDAGDTILHPHPSFAELFSQVCAERGIDVPPARVQEVQESVAPHLIEFATQAGFEHWSFSAETSQSFWRLVYQGFLKELGFTDEELREALLERFSDKASYMLFDDALSTLHELRDAGYRLGLISNFEQWLEERLIELEVGHLFDTSVISGYVRIEKPDPRIYELALEQSGVDASRAVHVGDSVSMDVEPAASVGITTVLLDRTGRYPDVPGIRIDSLKELPSVVSKL